MIISYCKPSSKELLDLVVFFEDRRQLQRAQQAFTNLSPIAKSRNVAVLVNPIAGKRKSRSIFRTILRPMLNKCKIPFEVFETTSAIFVEEWVNDISTDPIKYSEVFLVGGDGLFSQYLNAVAIHPQAERLLKLPIGILPGGSQNAISCDLGCKNAYIA